MLVGREAGRLWEEKGERVGSMCPSTQGLLAALGRGKESVLVLFMVLADLPEVPAVCGGPHADHQALS